MRDEPAALREQQFRLSRHIRDPEANPPPPGVEERRLAVYRELFFNNIESLLHGSFPVASALLGSDAWRALVRRFYATHHSQTPLFAEIAQEFVRFLHEDGTGPQASHPWLPELAHYEWVELALQLAEDATPAHESSGDLLDEVPVMSALAWPLAYRWPVQQLAPGQLPLLPPEQPTLLLVRRDAAHEVKFSALSPLVFRLLQIIGPATETGRKALESLAAEAAPVDPAEFLASGISMLHRLRAEGTLVGTRPA